jgi:hypothetical protein
MEAGRLEVARRRVRLALLVLPGVLALTLVVASRGAAAPPYEPNNSTLEAAGPLLLGQTYAADLVPEHDRDFYRFYVTAAGGAQVELSITNVGGGTENSDIDLLIFDTTATPIAGLAFVRKGEEQVARLAMEPGRYYVEVTSNAGWGDTYLLSPRGSEGAFVPYEQIAGRCGKATANLNAAKRRLRKSQGRLARSVGRLRRSLYSGPRARKRARLAHRRARAKVRSARRGLQRARASVSPWCSIPQ